MNKILAILSMLLIPLLLVGCASSDDAKVKACKRKTNSSMCMIQLALGNHTIAQNELGNMYFRGDGVPQSYAQALYWYKKSALKGYAIAQNKLGIMYENGQGVKQSNITAYAWYSLAENHNAHYFMGHDFKDLKYIMTKREIRKGIELAKELHDTIE